MSRPSFKPRWLLVNSAVLFSAVLSSVSQIEAQTKDDVRVAQLGEIEAQDAFEDAETTIVKYPDESADAAEQASDAPLAERAEALERRAGEQIGNDPHGRAIVLGMYIQEADNQRGKVVEVAPASPAFDAGILDGDEIVSFDGFKADSYREWVDGIRKLVTDTPEGDSLPIVVQRGDETINLRLRVPESRADDVVRTEPLNQQLLPPVAPGGTQVIPGGTQQPNYPVGGYGGGVFGGFFNDEENQNANGDTIGRAIAHIFHLSFPQGVNSTTGTNVAGRTTNVNTGGQVGRAGIAGFRNDQGSMMVFLDVGGLRPGSYLVGIDDPSVLVGANAGFGTGGTNVPPGAAGGVRGTPSPRGTTPPRTDPPRLPVGPQRGGAAAPAGQGPAGAPPAGGGRSQSQMMPRDGATEIPRTILAQVSDASQTADGASQPSTAPPTGQVRQATIPPAGQIREPGRIDDPPNLRIGDPGAPPTGSPDDPLLNEPTTNEILGADDATGGIAAGPAIRIGTLTVNQNGIGRMQQIVEGVQVQDVIGQALTIYSPNLAVGANNQSNLNPVADPITGRPAVTPEGGALRQPAPRTPAGGAPIGPTANRVLRPGNTISAAGNANANMNLPVAGGVIEELSGASLDALGTGGLPASDLNAPVANQANPGAQSEQLLAPVTGPQGVTDFPRNGQRPINPAPPAPLRDSGVQPPARVDPQ